QPRDNGLSEWHVRLLLASDASDPVAWPPHWAVLPRPHRIGGACSRRYRGGDPRRLTPPCHVVIMGDASRAQARDEVTDATCDATRPLRAPPVGPDRLAGLERARARAAPGPADLARRPRDRGR